MNSIWVIFPRTRKYGSHMFFLIVWTPRVQGTEDTELTLTREGDYIGSTDDIVEAIHLIFIGPR